MINYPPMKIIVKCFHLSCVYAIKIINIKHELYCGSLIYNQKQSVIGWREFAICCAHLVTASHTVNMISVCSIFCFLGILVFFVWVSLPCWMPWLTIMAWLMVLAGTDLSLSPVTSDVISSALTRATI